MVDFAAVIGPLSAALGASVVVERIIAFAKNFLEPLIGVHGTRLTPKLSEVDKKIDDLKYMYELNDASQAIDEGAQRLAPRRSEIISQLKTETDPAKKQALEEALRDLIKNEPERMRRLEEIESKLLAETDPEKKKVLEHQLQDIKVLGEWDEQFPMSKMLVEPATDPDDGTTLRAVIIQLLGFAAGILLARTAGIQLFHAFLGQPAPCEVPVAPWLDYVLTGLLIGGGSAPVHLLITFISERRVPEEAAEPVSEEKKTAKAAVAAEEQPAGPAVITALSDAAAAEWVDIPYYGGVDRDILESIHKRTKDPDMVVFHHTAMSSRSTFEDVVRVIKSRTDSKGNRWLTGYNCVILADGSVHAFCRWDRYGSHAVGYNQRSLGITFNGNFETDPKVPFSNPTGKYGTPRPTEEQVKAGARVVTLWTKLYPINVDFENSIIPHKQISDKTCPGNMFPYDDLKRWIDFYRKKWDRSSFAKERIEAFRQKPYLFVPKKEGRS